MDNNENAIIKYHFELLRDNVPRVLKKLDDELAYYRLYFEKNIKNVEVMFDTPTNLLSSAGIVLSKEYDGEKYSIKVKKISYLPTELRRPSKKFYSAECGKRELPKDYPIQIAGAINNAFSNLFTIDLVEVVKQTTAVYEIKVKGKRYNLTSGTGMKGNILYEKITYRDVQTGRKVKRKGFTISLPDSSIFQKETQEILDVVSRKVKELWPYNESRFELAQRLLRPKRKSGEKISRKELKAKLKQEQEESDIKQ